MPKKRRLPDLFVVGKDHKFTDGRGEDVELYLRKTNPFEEETVQRRASAAKARYLLQTDDPESDAYLETYLAVREYPEREPVAMAIVADDIIRARMRIQAQLEAEPFWSEDDRLQGAIDAWNGDEENAPLSDRYALEPDDPEALAVKAILDEFNTACVEALDVERELLMGPILALNETDFWAKGTEAMIKREADTILINEINTQRVYYGCRERDDHAKKHFNNVDEVRTIDEVLRMQIVLAIDLLTVDAMEGKGSEEIQGSSPSSDSPETQETSASSGPLEQTDSETSDGTSSTPSTVPS